jgi:hypothetical protein
MGVVLEAPEEARGERVEAQWIAERRGLELFDWNAELECEDEAE